MRISRWKALCLISFAELFALSLWFSASAILPELKVAWSLNSITASWVTSSVQIGLIGWNWVFFFLSIGPILGVISMLKLKKLEAGDTIARMDG